MPVYALRVGSATETRLPSLSTPLISRGIGPLVVSSRGKPPSGLADLVVLGLGRNGSNTGLYFRLRVVVLFVADE